MYLWIDQTKQELQMPYLITLGLVETIFDPVVDRVKMEFAGATTIKRDRVFNELVIFMGLIVLVLVLVLVLMLVLDKTKGIPLVEYVWLSLWEMQETRLRFYHVSSNIESSC